MGGWEETKVKTGKFKGRTFYYRTDGLENPKDKPQSPAKKYSKGVVTWDRPTKLWIFRLNLFGEETHTASDGSKRRCLVAGDDQNSPARKLLAASGGRHHRRLVVLERL